MVRVLIVDDSDELLDFLSQLLRLYKYEVECAASKSELSFKLPKFSPDIILMDVMLKGEDGREICKGIKKNSNNVPVLLMSASPKLLDGYTKCDACDIIEKPFDIKTVIEKITKWLPKR